MVRLNREAGALYPALLADGKMAEEMLFLFLARGVDINAGDERTQRLTALHTMALEGDAGGIRLLLKYNARVDVRDSEGRTPLDIARPMLRQHAAEPGRAEVVKLLEDAARQQVLPKSGPDRAG